MFDSISFLTARVLKQDVATAIARNLHWQCGQWEFDAYKKPPSKCATMGPAFTVRLVGHKSGLFAKGIGNRIEFVNFQPSALLFCSNGVHLHSEEELHQAFDGLNRLLDEISVVLIPIKEIVRVDVAMNLPVPVGLVINAHRRVTHPWFRKEPLEYYSESGSSLCWKSEKRRIKIYDKRGKSLGRQRTLENPRDSLRVEISLKSRRSIALFLSEPEGKPIRRLCFGEFYAALRRALSQFDPHPVLEDKLTVYRLLALAEASGLHIGGISTLDLYLDQISSEHVRRAIKRIRAEGLSFRDVRWAHLLPPDGSPTLIDVFENGSCQLTSIPSLGPAKPPMLPSKLIPLSYAWSVPTIPNHSPSTLVKTP